MIARDIENRRVPPILLPGATADNWPQRREEILQTFQREVYGVTPPAVKPRAAVVSREERAWAGKASHTEYAVSFEAPLGEFTFPLHVVLPVGVPKPPMFLYLSFTAYPIPRYGIIEEIVDNGYGFAIVYYNDISEDRADDFAGGMATKFDRSNDDGTVWGKIGMWAYAASRAMDVLEALEDVDASRVCVAGHSRLGKTSLWCGAQDERFAAVMVNSSGCTGAAITRDKQGERVEHIVNRFPYWFCANYRKYAGREHDMPFDQHQLLACVAPRPLYIGNSVEDIWCDPYSEFLSCVEADKVYKLLGKKGFVYDRYVEVGEALHDGDMAYHLRAGTHFMSRTDWNFVFRYMRARI